MQWSAAVVEQTAGGVHERRSGAVGGGILGHHHHRIEHGLVGAAAAVGGQSQKHVDTQQPPQLCVVDRLMHISAEGGGAEFAHRGRAVATGGLHHVAHTGGAVVEKEIVSVVAVIGEIVLLEQQEEIGHLAGGELQCLFPHSPLLAAIGAHKTVETSARETIVEFALRKTQIEVRHAKVESTVVVHPVDGLGSGIGVADADGRVAETQVELVARAAGDDAGTRRIAEGDGLRRRCKGQHHANPHHGHRTDPMDVSSFHGVGVNCRYPVFPPPRWPYGRSAHAAAYGTEVSPRSGGW